MEIKHYCADSEYMTAWCGADTTSIIHDFSKVSCIPCLLKFLEEAALAKAQLEILKLVDAIVDEIIKEEKEHG